MAFSVAYWATFPEPETVYDLAFEIKAAGLQHLFCKINLAVTGSFRTDQTAAPFEAFTGQNAGEFIAQPFVLAEHETDLTAANTDITGRNVSIRTDMTLQFGHEALAETHHFIVGFSFGIEIASAFSTAHGQCGEAVLQHLLESKEFQDAEVHGRVETQTAFVRTDRAVHLNAVTLVDLDFAFVIHPGNAEQDHAFRFCNPFEDLCSFVLRIFFNEGNQCFCHFLTA